MDAADEDHPKIVAFPPLLWLIGAVVSVLVHYFVFSIRILPEPLAMILGIICLLVGPSLALPALFTMRAADPCQSRQTSATDRAGWALPVHSQPDVSGPLSGAGRDRVFAE
jgi:hypothetical protein